LRCPQPELAPLLANGGEARLIEGGHLDIVKANDGEILRHAKASVPEPRDHAERRGIGGTKDRRWSGGRGHGKDLPRGTLSGLE